MTFNEINDCFADLTNFLEKSEDYINNNKEKIKNKINTYKLEITLNEIKESLTVIKTNITKWHNAYKQTKNILTIDLNEYDIVAKEASFLVGEAALIKEIYVEAINHIILEIGEEICSEIKGVSNE